MSVIINNSFDVEMAHKLQEIQGILYQLVNMKITILDGEFPILSGIEYVTVNYGTTEISPFIIRFSQNQKELHAGFSNNAFSGMTGNISISFGFGANGLGNISEEPLSIAPLDPLFAGLASSSTIA